MWQKLLNFEDHTRCNESRFVAKLGCLNLRRCTKFPLFLFFGGKLCLCVVVVVLENKHVILNRYEVSGLGFKVDF